MNDRQETKVEREKMGKLKAETTTKLTVKGKGGGVKSECLRGDMIRRAKDGGAERGKTFPTVE